MIGDWREICSRSGRLPIPITARPKEIGRPILKKSGRPYWIPKSKAIRCVRSTEPTLDTNRGTVSD